MTPTDSEFILTIKSYLDEGESDTPIHDVSGYKLSEKGSFAIEMTAWDIWLGMDISQETLLNYPEEEVLVHALWEMTFCGYEENDGVDLFNEIVERKNEYEKNDRFRVAKYFDDYFECYVTDVLSHEEAKKEALRLQELEPNRCYYDYITLRQNEEN
jgi:hypothetical protein